MIYTNEEKAMFAYLNANGISEKEASALNTGAAQYYRELADKFVGLTFLDKSSVDEKGNEHLAKGATTETLAELEQAANTMAQVNKLNKWLTTALSAKETLLTAINDLSVEDYCDENGQDCPSLKSSDEYIRSLDLTLPKSPSKKEAISDEEAVGLLSLANRNRYYTLNAECAVLGKFLHKEGAFSKAREEFQHALGTPVELVDHLSVMMVYTNTPSVDAQTVEDTFFALQAKYRSCQAELNGINKLICQAKIDDAKQKAELFAEQTENYSKARKAYNDSCLEYKAYVVAYNQQVAELRKQVEDLQKSEIKKINQLKYVVPAELNGILQEVKQRYHLG